MAGNRDWGVSATTLTVPFGAGPNDPRITIGPDVPAALIAAVAPQLVESAILFFTPDGANYFFIVNTFAADHLTGEVFMGWVQNTTNVKFISEYIPFTGNDNLNNALTFTGLLSVSSDVGDTTNSGGLALGQSARFEIDQKSHERGLIDRVDSTANSAAVGAEAIILTGNSVTWRNGRAYEILMGAFHIGSVVNFGIYQIRKTNLAGAIIAGMGQWDANAGHSVETQSRYIIRRAAGAGDLTANIVLTLTASAGTIVSSATAAKPRYLEVRDCGAASDYPNAPAIT